MKSSSSRWRDGWLMFRYRQSTVCLSAWRWHVGATGGSWLRLLLDQDRTPRAVYLADGLPLIAWGELIPGQPTGWWTHVAPAEALHADPLPSLVERLACQVAQGGARYLAAEVPADAPWQDALRRAGLLPLAQWQIWRWAPVEAAPTTDAHPRWEPLGVHTLDAARALMRRRVPPAVRPVLHQPQVESTWWVCRYGDDLLGLAWLQRGPRGIWLALFLDAGADGRRALLALTAQGIIPRYAPTWLCALPGGAEAAVDALGAQPEPAWLLLARPTGATSPVTAAQPESVAHPLRPLVPHSS